MLRLKAERLKRGWSQQACAVRAGMHLTEICRIERGYLKPYPIQAERLAQALGLSPDELLQEVPDEVRDTEPAG